MNTEKGAGRMTAAEFNFAEVKPMEQQSVAEKKPNRKTLIILGAVVAAVIVIIAAAMAVRHNNEVNYRIERVVSELENCTQSGKPSYPEVDDYVLGTDDSYYEQVKDNQKLAKAITAAMEDFCTDAGDNESSGGAFEASGIQRVYSMAAVLEYLGYENEKVKECMDGLVAQALTEVQGQDNWLVTRSVYIAFLKYKALPYYTSDETLLPDEEIISAYAARWQEVKREMPNGKANLDDFLEEVMKIATTSPVTIPARIDGTLEGSDMATGVNGAPVLETYLDVEKMLPYNELVDALEEHGESAIFQNGKGGYYDNKKNKGAAYGDFCSVYKSGRVPRTGNEDAFTEQYLREHYDKPSTTTYYFRGEEISAFPPFFTDTEQVFVYGGKAYALTAYGVYFDQHSMLPYDLTAAKDAEWKHVTLSEMEQQTSMLSYVLESCFPAVSQFNPRFEYDVENKLATIYLTALPGTTEALKAGTEAPITAGAGRTATWDDFRAYLADMCTEMYEKVEWEMPEPTGISMILVSDVNSESGLLSILNGEVVQDNSQNPPAPSETEESAPDETPSPDESPTPTEAP